MLVVGICALVALGFGFGSLPASADQAPSTNTTSPTCTAVQLSVGNPPPGDLLEPGTYVIQGSASDVSAAQAPGIDRVQVFFDNARENGGSFIGEVLAGQDSAGQHLTASAFSLMARLPDTSATDNTHMIFFYARSASTGQEEVVSFQMHMKKPLVGGGAFGFQLVAPLPKRAGGHVLSIYARSAITGRETSVSVPITIT